MTASVRRNRACPDRLRKGSRVPAAPPRSTRMSASWPWFPAMASFVLTPAFAGLAQAELAFDPSFGAQGVAVVDFAGDADRAAGLAPDEDGTLVLAGRATIDGALHLAVTRVDENGDAVDEFGEGGLVSLRPVAGNQRRGDAWATAVAVEPASRKIVAAGTWADTSDTDLSILVARLLPDGTPDEQFGEDGIAVIDLPGMAEPQAHALALADEGRVLVAGTARIGEIFHGFVARVDENGDLDDTFAGDGVFVHGSVSKSEDLTFRTFCSPPSPKILVAGDDLASIVVRLLPDGTLDETFAENGVATVAYEDEEKDVGNLLCGQQPGGSLLIGGSARERFGSVDGFLRRLGKQGQPDASFAGDGVLALEASLTGSPAALVVREGGDFVVSNSGGTLRHFNSNASISAGLSAPGPEDAFYALYDLPDGAVAAAGVGSGAGALADFGVARLNVTRLECGACGELNGDCAFTTSDALLALRMAVGQSEPNLLADADASGVVTAGDALGILRVAVGLLRPRKPCPIL